MTSAEFSINADPYANLGYDTTVGSTLTLQLTGATFDAYSCVYEVVQKSQGAPDIAELGPIGGGGAAATPLPTSPLNITMPGSGVHSYIIRCTINNGQNSATGAVEVDYTKQRLAAIKFGTRRKICPAESTQYDPVNGWTGPYNNLIETALENPSSGSTDNALVRWDGVTGNTLQNSGAILNDTGHLSGLASLSIGDAPTTGTIRLGKESSLTTLNNAETQTLPLLSTDASNNIIIGGNTTDITSILFHVGTAKSFIWYVNNVQQFLVNQSYAQVRDVLTIGETVADSGTVRLTSTGAIRGRNTANSANLDMILLGANSVVVGGNNATQAGVQYHTNSSNLHSFQVDNVEKLTIGANLIVAEVPVRLPSYTVATLPGGLNIGSEAYCTDEVGGAVPVFFDGADWRRCTDRAVAST